ncbi:DUF6346 domain-containing protein [Lentzea sp. NPDC051213]|uniref:DUF6346 domain-containing protein n=1 Tax=Lentzea sp. NPDC051213 TaxID=3364126 RepID=UPI0037A9F205
MTKTKRIAVAAVLWIAALYCAQASTLFFDGDSASGGDPSGYAQDISCKRNWYAFGLLWYCEATIVTDDGERIPYTSKNSLLTPADIGKQVPMTTNLLRTGGRSSRATAEWGLAERVEPNKVAYVLCLMGPPGIALLITFRLFRDKKTVT